MKHTCSTPSFSASPREFSSRRRGRVSRRSGGAFTLIEVLCALALVALVMVALNTFIFSMGELWGKNNETRLFERHVRSVTRFLDSEMRTAALPPVGRLNTVAIAPKEIRTQSGTTEPLLTFELPAGSRLINWPDRPLPDVVCSLVVRDRDGLVLLWHSRLEKKFAQDPPRETVITPLVTGMSYDYYDADFKRWRNETQLRKESNGEVKPPQRLRLKFAYQKLTAETVVTLPTTTEGLPQF
ncbi:MAG TPA: prepilin-type N-terminal cleavage/methylation domain-containing protein [Opitutaceae bacterium]|nr:prepilin-type N-terminal cleavage/methylation domain-containing protein [Opitutaceae bacterium]